MIGLVVKIFSDFFYVKTPQGEVFESKVREILKKSQVSILVGDNVKLEEISYNPNQAAISELLPRKNFIIRPAVANIDKVIIVSSIKNPEFDYIQMNRYLCFAKWHGIEPIICINKNDLEPNDQTKNQIKNIYQKLGYQVLFVSAKEKQGIEEFISAINNQICVLCGQSGVGKSSLINAILPSLNLKVGDISQKTSRGTHTTRHSELIEISLDEVHFYIADTPGFSNLKFNEVPSSKIVELFDEINDLSKWCKYNDCLHIDEDGCHVLNNLDKISDFQYESYQMFLKEAQMGEELSKKMSLKVQEKIKISGGKKLLKISAKNRENSRKKARQNLNKLDIEDLDE